MATEFSKTALGPVAASDGCRSGSLLAVQPSDAAASPRKFYWGWFLP